MKSTVIGCFVMFLLCVAVNPASAADWIQFRGPDSLGISGETDLPLSWSETENLAWKIPLPGPGSSSPIVYKGRVYLTCYSGYGVDRNAPGELKNLKRHLLCVDLGDGKIVWSKTVAAEMPEDSYGGFITEHGYASSTPITDGERIYVFYGKSGVLAYDLAGKELWRVNVGRESSNVRWGSASSPILYKNLVIVNASEESQSIRALDKTTGKEAWKIEATSLDLSYGTPQLASLADGRKELILGVPSEVWAMDPDSGKFKWYAKTELGRNISPSPVVGDGVVYVFGGRPAACVAIRTGGKDDVTDSGVLWSSGEASYVPSPVLHEGHLYWTSDQGIAYCKEAKTGKTVYAERMPRASGGSRMPFYASTVLADGRLYVVSRTGGTIVLAAGPEFKQLAQNRFESDTSDFNGSPAISDGRILLRSNRFLYCILKK